MFFVNKRRSQRIDPSCYAVANGLGMYVLCAICLPDPKQADRVEPLWCDLSRAKVNVAI